MLADDADIMQKTKVELVSECKRQYENCLYTSASLNEWLKRLHQRKSAFVMTAIVFGSLGSLTVFTQSTNLYLKTIGSVMTWLAGLSPAFYTALRFEQHVEDCKSAAAEFTNLRDRFRQASSLKALLPLDQFQEEFDDLMVRVESVRGRSIMIPELYFQRARQKIKAGEYSFDAEPGATQPSQVVELPDQLPG